MARYQVHTPVAGFAGEVGGVSFMDGTAEVDSDVQAAALAYFQAAGYTVVSLDDDEDSPAEESAAPRKSTRRSKSTEEQS